MKVGNATLLGIGAVLAALGLVLTEPASAYTSGYQMHSSLGRGGTHGSYTPHTHGVSSCPYVNDCFGRCGPGCSTVFGSVTTTACTNHDQCIKDRECTYGDSGAAAQVNCVGLLGAAAGSLIQYHWDNFVNWVKDDLGSVWARI